MGRDHPQHDQRDQQHVNDEKARNDLRSRIVTPKDEEGDVTPNNRDRLDDGECNPNTGSRHQVVGERVSEESFDDAQNQKRRAKDVVQLTWLTEGASKEHPRHVYNHGRQENVTRPVVHLTHQQAAAH